MAGKVGGGGSGTLGSSSDMLAYLEGAVPTSGGAASHDGGDLSIWVRPQGKEAAGGKCDPSIFSLR